MLIPIIEYEIYNIKTKEKLNLSICKNDKIDISIPININENNLYKYNISDDYYNNICNVTDNDIDIIINDRRNEYYINNMSVCEKDCFFKDCNYSTKNVICKCLIKINFPLLSELYIDKDMFLNNLINISNIMNIDVIKYYHVLFSKEGLIKNIGNYILLSIRLIEVILLLLFIKKGSKEIESQVEYIIINKNNNENQNIKGIKNNPPKNTKKRNIKKNISNFETMNDNSNFRVKNNNIEFQN